MSPCTRLDASANRIYGFRHSVIWAVTLGILCASFRTLNPLDPLASVSNLYIVYVCRSLPARSCKYITLSNFNGYTPNIILAQYTFIRDLRVMDVDGVKTWVVLARYELFASCGEKDGIIRVNDFKQACVMQSDGKVGSKGIVSVNYVSRRFVHMLQGLMSGTWSSPP